MCVCVCVCVCAHAHSVVSDSLWLYELQPIRLLCPYNFPGKNMKWVAISYSRGPFWPRGRTCHLPPIPTQHALAPRSSFLPTPVFCALLGEFPLLFPAALSHTAPLSVSASGISAPHAGCPACHFPFIGGPWGWPNIICSFLGFYTQLESLFFERKRIV